VRCPVTTKIISVLFILLLVAPLSASAEITEQGTGMLYGPNHAFFVTAPKGWVLDNESGVKQGIHMVFYPVGYTWANSPVIVYGQSVTKDAKMRSVKDQVESTIKMFHEKGSTGYKITKETSITFSDGKKASIYYYAGDKWGNFEAAAYFEEKNTINFLVLNARKKPDYDKYLSGFELLVRSYRNSGNLERVDESTFKKLVQESKRVTETPSGKAYEESIIKKSGEAIGAVMRSCSEYVGASNVKPFEVIFRIKPDGMVAEAFVSPDSILGDCFAGYLLRTKHPTHQFESYLFYINMNIN
jgi:hypothetical protein